MAVSNLGISLSAIVGGSVYDYGLTLFSTRTTFDGLVAVGATTTALAWFIVPWLMEGVAAIPDDPSLDDETLTDVLIKE